VSKRRSGLVATSLLAAMLGAFGILARADTGGTTGLGFDDAYTQIVNHKIPVEPDGKPTYFSGGRHYVGPNGWEIRLNHATTVTTMKVVMLIDGIAIGAAAEAATGASVLAGAVYSVVNPVYSRPSFRGQLVSLVLK
jgi:hypothetical protein